MAWREPEYEGEFPSLGWAIVDWWEATFKVPGGELAGHDLKLTDDQVDFFVRWYRIDPKTGRYVYRRGSRRGAKGRGKSPEGALYLAASFLGDTVFDGWDDRGEPVGRPRINPLCWAAAASEDQTDNVYSALHTMLSEAEIPGVDVGKTRVEFTDGRKGFIRAVTAAADSKHGAPVTDAVLDEPHVWVPSKGGVELAKTIRNNLTKTGGRSLEVTNAPELGEGSVAENTLNAFEKGQRGLLYSSKEPDWDDELDPKDEANKDAVMSALKVAYEGVTIAEGGWIDLERVYEDCMDVDTPATDILRYFFNLARKGTKKAFDPSKLKPLKRSDRVVAADEPCMLMFDGARTRDCAVLSAWTIGDTPHHFEVQVWERPANASGDYEHPRGEIKGAVREFMAAHDCVLFAYDSSFHDLNSMYDDWLDEYGEAGKDGGIVLGYPTATGKRMEAAVLRVQEDTRAGRYTHDGSEAITAHLHNAITVKNRGGWTTLAKEKDSMKIDGAVTFTFGYDLIATARELLVERGPAHDPDRSPILVLT